MSNAVKKLEPKPKAASVAPVENIHTALCAAQAEIKNPPKEKDADTGAYQYKYADISDVLETVLPVLSAHGIAVCQAPKIVNDQMILITTLTHGASDTNVSCEYPVASANNNHQKLGGALTYARRYALCALVGVAPAQDLDGQDAAKSGDGDRQKMSAAEAKREIDWEGIENSIRKAKSHDILDKMDKRFEANRGVWPASFIASCFEESAKRRNELDMQARADGFDSEFDAFEACQTVDDVIHMTEALIQLGKDADTVKEAADLRKEALETFL